MPKDYAKRSREQDKEPIYKSMTFWAVLLAVVIVAVLYSFRYTRQTSSSEPGLPPVRTGESVAPVYKAREATSTPALVQHEEEGGRKAKVAKTSQPIKYEFYSMLPKTPVVKAAETVPVAPQVPTEENQPGYWLQIGAYYTEDSADDYLARVQLLGLDPKIFLTPAKTKEGHDIYRVEVGPLDSYQEAKQKREELEQMKVDSMIRKVS